MSISDLEEQDDMSKLIRAVTNSSQHHPDQPLASLSSLAKKLSRRSNRSARDEIKFSQDFNPETFELETMLKALVKSSNEQGIKLRSTGVVLEKINTIGVDASTSFAATVADVLKAPVTIANKIKDKRHQKVRNLIVDFTGMVKPGEMCLVLGKPGAGCSTILKTIAGEIDQFIDVKGDISYDGLDQKEMIKHYKNDVIYNGELEFHFPHLTVDQTLTFAIACKTPLTRVDNITRAKYIDIMKQMYATILGLTHTYDTKVGNDFIRGVSGGERKRVSIAEAMATKASVYCWDNATRGLDSATALEFTKAIRTQTNIMNTVSFVTVYQASENIYDCFDKVTVLYDGYQIFFGDIEDAKNYFVEMGYEHPKRQSTPEFLTAITDPIGRFARPGFENKVPKTAKEFYEHWIKSDHYKRLLSEIAEYKSLIDPAKTRELYDVSKSQEQRNPHHLYTLPYLEQVKLLTIRGFQRVYGDKAFTIARTVSAIIQSLITGSLFYNTPSATNGAFSRSGTIFFMVLYFSLMGLAEISTQFSMRPILLKQKSYSLYHLSAEALAGNFSRFPFQLISIVCFYIIVYFLSGLTRDAGKFFIIILFLIVTSETVVGLFNLVAAVSRNVQGANAVAGLMILGIVLYSCYMIQLKKMHPWFKWLSYLNPVRWGFESMLVTEFHGRKMDCGSSIVPSGEGYENVSSANQVCAFVGSETGQTWVLGDRYMDQQYSFNYSHVWRNFGFILAFYFGFLILYCLATEYKRPVGSGGDHLYFKRSAERVHKLRQSQEDEESSVSDNTETKAMQMDDDSTNNKVLTELGSKDIFAWKNLTYVIPYKGAERTLLDNIHGYVKPGTLTALMGESGAGKTTLLNTLAKRTDIGVVTGDIMVNGLPLTHSFKRNTGYVQQQDLHISELTVRESLQFAARLRRPKSVSDEEKLEYVEEIIKILHMEAYADALVGEVGAGLNVEQRKKLSIGVELVSKPSLLLFLDEPTSGLDSQSSWAIVQLLKDLANAGQSILCTIHQPSATLFESFDRLLLLKKGGKTVYFGDIGENSETMLEYFERNGARKCEIHENPAEYILEAIGAGVGHHTEHDWSDLWRQSPEYVQSLKEVDEIMALKRPHEITDEGEDMNAKYAMPYFDQLRFVIARTALQFWRSPQYVIGSKFGLMVNGGLFIGFSFWNLDSSIIGMQDGMFAAFLSIIVAIPSMNQIQSKAIPSRELFEVRESKSNTFHWSALLIGQYFAEIPYHFVASALYFCCLYFPLRINDAASRAGVFYLNYSIIFQLYYISLGLLIVYASHDLPSAAIFTGLTNSLLISFCGVTQPESLMPGFWTFMWKVSPYTYFVQNMLSIVLHKKKVVCKEYELSFFQPPEGQTCQEFAGQFLKRIGEGYLSNPDATSNCGYCQYSVADEYLAKIGIFYKHIWRNLGFYWVYICFNLIALCSMYYMFRVAQKSPIGYLAAKLEKRKNAKTKKAAEAEGAKEQ